MTTIEKDKKDTFDHILEKAKQEYWDYIDDIVHPSIYGHIVTQEEWERRQKEARKEHKENPLLYYSDKIHGWVPDYEKSIEDIQKDYDANARIRNELLEKEHDISYLCNLISKQKTTKGKFTHIDFSKNKERYKPVPKIETKPNRPVKRDFLHKSEWQAKQEKNVDDIEIWKREVQEEFDKKLVAERNAKFGTGEGMTKTQWIKHIHNKIKEIEDEIKVQVPKRRSDKGFVPQKSPQQMYIKMIAEVECECKADNICDTCKLFNRLWQYTLDLFKDAAEGRTSYV